MSPNINAALLANTLVDVWNDTDQEHKPRLVRNLMCPECGCRSNEMTWEDSERPGEPELVCSCGEIFRLSSSATTD
jgi:hypothetical protein